MNKAKGLSRPFLQTDGRDATTSSRAMSADPATPTLGDEFKIFVSRIPAAFDESSVRRLVETALHKFHRPSESDADAASNAVVSVSLAYEKDEDTVQTTAKVNKTDDRFADRPRKKKSTKATPPSTLPSDTEPAPPKPHKGYGFVTLSTVELVHEAIASVRTIRGGAKPTSTRHYTLYIGPCLSDEQKAAVQRSEQVGNPVSGSSNSSAVCFLWTAGRCPYGPECRFAHTGPGGCAAAVVANATGIDSASTTGTLAIVKKPRKCRDYRKGKCQFSANDCPYSHDFVVPAKGNSSDKSLAEKDCIDWKTKGKCRNLSKQRPCPYKHDPAKQKKRPRENGTTESQSGSSTANAHDAVLDSSQRPRKVKQPLTVRVFGLNYDTNIEAIRALFSPCGRIVDLQLPTFADSGRNKGYCGIVYTSPQAVAAAVSTCHGVELDGRWISVQAGAMLLDQWEEHHTAHRTAKK
jgi:RNA recognition motif-containing protein